MDKVLHSIVVALEIFQFRCRFLGHPATPRVHPPSECLFMQIKSSLNSIQEVIEREMLKGNAMLKPRAIDILNNVKSEVDAIDAK